MATQDELLAEVLHGPIDKFLGLMHGLMLASNEERGSAEKLYEKCKEFPNELVARLLSVLKTKEYEDIHGLSSVLLRKLISKDNIASKLSGLMLSKLKTEILEILFHDTKVATSRKLADGVGELANSVLEEQGWPELLPVLYQWISGQDERLQECALWIFGDLSGYVSEHAGPHLPTLYTALQQCLVSSAKGDIRLAALRTSSDFIGAASNKEKLNLQALLPSMVQVLTTELNSNNEESARDALEIFVDMAETDPKFLKKQLADIVAVMLQVAETKDLDEETRHLALEFLVTLIENREQAPGMMKKVPQALGRMFALLLNMLLDIEDKEEWYKATNDHDDFSEGDYQCGLECLDRIAMALQGNTVVPLASQLLPPFLGDPDWRKRHAALMALGQIAEGCSKAMMKITESVVSMALSSFRDPHPRVRHAAINAIAQLCLDLQSEVQTKHHQVVVPALIMAMDEVNFPRIQAHAIAAILNYSDSAPAESMTPYMDALVSKLLTLLQAGGLMVQEEAVTALAAIADNAQEQFVKYYDVVMPFLKTILVNFQEKERRLLRSKALECISLVGVAVGKEKFRGDAKEVIDVLIQLQNTKLDDDDPLPSYMLQGWTRLCKCLGQEFLPLMPVVMPSLYRVASMKPDVALMDSDDEIDEDDDEVEVIEVGEKRLSIRTSDLEDKAMACNMLCCYAEELKEGFFPWVDEVAQLMVPLLKFYFHEDVRTAAAQCLPDLLKSTQLAFEKGTANKDPAYPKQLFDHLVVPLVDTLALEPESNVLVELLESLNEIVKSFGSMLSADQVKKIVEQLLEVTKSSRAKKQSRLDRYEADEFDDDEKVLMDEENEAEDSVYEQVGEVIGSMIKVLKADFIPFFEELIPYMLPLLQKGVSSEERRITICIFDDAAETYQGGAAKYYPTFLPLILEASMDQHVPDIRQAASYGIGVCAEFGGLAFRPFAIDALDRLSRVASQPDCRSPENECATDNIISAIGKICEFHAEGLNTESALFGWLNYLPMRKDTEEAKSVHKQLCTFLERGDVRLFGQNYQNLPRILAVLADILSAKLELASEETVSRIKALLAKMQQTLGQDILAMAWNTLQPQQQAALQS